MTSLCCLCIIVLVPVYESISAGLSVAFFVISLLGVSPSPVMLILLPGGLKSAEDQHVSIMIEKENDTSFVEPTEYLAGCEIVIFLLLLSCSSIWSKIETTEAY